VGAATKSAAAEISYAQIDREVLKTLEPPGRIYWAGIAFLFALIALAAAAWTRQIYVGLRVTGLRQPVMWAVYITNFVFWVGIAHSGTLISAILFLFRVRWRTAVYRSAEAMTLFAVATAGLFPIIHLGRSWFFYWLLPYPNERWLQPNFRSPLVWDAFAVSTYATVSAIFLFFGMIPDVAAVRDKTVKGARRAIYSVLALGWRGTDEQWRHYSMAYLLLAGLATPLVISVHSVVSWDFAMAQLPGWHSTIFAPYFVAGAIFSGVAMVITIMIPLRKMLGLENLVTLWHFDNLAKVVLFTSIIMSYSYATESFMVYYAGDPYELVTFHERYFGPIAPFFWLMIFCNCCLPLLLFSPRIRTNLKLLWVITIFVNIGMWLERFVIIAGSLATNFMPNTWAFYRISLTELLITIGSFAWFLFLYTLFCRVIPIVSMTELKEGARWLRKALREPYSKAA
jgi:Ni/Fe-hydrogenase subunit HybB-like protein